MLEKHSISDHVFVECLKSSYGIQAMEVTFLPLGADTKAAMYKAQTEDHTRYFLKLKRGHHQDLSVEILEQLHAVGIQTIIPSIKAI